MFSKYKYKNSFAEQTYQSFTFLRRDFFWKIGTHRRAYLEIYQKGILELEVDFTKRKKLPVKTTPRKIFKSEASEKLEAHESEFKNQLLNEILNSSKQIVKVFMQRKSYDKLV